MKMQPSILTINVNSNPVIEVQTTMTHVLLYIRSTIKAINDKMKITTEMMITRANDVKSTLK